MSESIDIDTSANPLQQLLGQPLSQHPSLA
jgi:hypothetical protein